MARFEYDAKLIDYATGAWLFDRDCEVDISHDPRTGFSIDDVLVEGISLFNGGRLAREMAAEITDLVDNELGSSRSEFFAKVAAHFSEEYADAAYDRAASYADHRISVMKEEAL